MFPFKKERTIICFVVFCNLLLNAALSGSTELPDNVVWTSPTATFWLGDQDSTLSCRFHERPIAVYWMRGESPSTADIIVSWYNGVDSGPGVIAGTHTINTDYSLVFRRPVLSDTARYICRVSNHNAFLIYNHTDLRVLDPEQNIVSTIPSVTGWKGDTIVLPCDFHAEPARVIWNKEKTKDTTSLETVAIYSGGVYDVIGGDRYGWGDNRALTINGITVQDEANFTCIVTPFEGEDKSNSTSVEIFAYADEPFVRINDCESSSVSWQCTHSILNNQGSFELVCSVIGAKPAVDVFWVEGIFGADPLNETTSVIKKREGVFDITLTLTRDATQLSGDETFTCVASGEAVNGVTNQSVVLAVVIPEEGSSANGGVIAIGIIIVLLIVTAAIVIISIKCDIWYPPFLRGHLQLQDEEAQKEKLVPTDKLTQERMKLVGYKPGQFEKIDFNVDCINIGLFGPMAAGKSAFVNSLLFSVNGTYEGRTDESDLSCEGSKTIYRERINLTPKIIILDNKGLKDLDVSRIKELMEQIEGKRGQDPNRKVKHGIGIHCPIFVIDPRQIPIGTMTSFIKAASKEMFNLYGRQFKMVITNEDSIEDIEMTKFRICNETGLEKANVHTFENYTYKNHVEDKEKSMKYLEFIWECLKIAERNVRFKHQDEEDKAMEV